MSTLTEQLEKGMALFDAGRWFEAHEAWEDHWLAAEGQDRLFLQGLIQLAGALHKGLVMGHPPGMASLAHQAAQKLAHVSQGCPGLGGLDVAGAARLAHDVEVAARRWNDDGGAYPQPTPRLSSVALGAARCGCSHAC